MAADSDILSAALTRMNALTTSLPIAWPGVDFTPPSEGMWFEVRHFPNESENMSMEGSSKQLFIGFVQVSVLVRPGSGIVDLTAEAEKIQAHFPKGLDLGPVQVLKRPYQMAPVPDGDRISIPVTVPYRGIA